MSTNGDVSFWDKKHPVNSQEERIRLFKDLFDELGDLIGSRECADNPHKKPRLKSQIFHQQESILDIIKYYSEQGEKNIGLRLSEDYLKGRTRDKVAVIAYILQLLNHREVAHPERHIRKLKEADLMLHKLSGKQLDDESFRLSLDIHRSIAEHLPTQKEKEETLKQLLKHIDDKLAHDSGALHTLLLRRALLHYDLGVLQKQTPLKVEHFLRSLQSLQNLGKNDPITDFSNILLINFEELLSIAASDEECKKMIKIVESSFEHLLKGEWKKKHYILHNFAWLYYKKAKCAAFDTERDFYLSKSEDFMKNKDEICLKQHIHSNDSAILRAHIAMLKAQNEQIEIKKLHYMFDSIELYKKALVRAHNKAIIYSHIGNSYLQLARHEHDSFKKINLIEQSIEYARIGSRVGIDVTFAYRVLSEAYHMLEEIHTDQKLKELYYAKSVQYERQLH